ncbi:DNA polymerase III, delta prime subunit [Evansella cellulosilytica DSM 2522]|uniref:DNA polymerase III subunit delta' n=2 Tax=Evansella TaxID=2837485 RepID=E6TRN0_EVAC2|nr:DNA polymerase III subunit delta' [Evansella cellulosilytica]ADU28324.1 DNA polymerase III, delta prime subunit [Evansella cellulosilytica DSM 2522]
MIWEELKATQSIVVKMLTNSIKKNRLSHAYLFEGPRGTGKKEVANALTKSFFCQQKQGFEPCDNCSDCKRIDSGNHPDVHTIKSEGQTIKVDQIRHLKKEFSFRGMESTKKVYLVEDAEKMTIGAANSILKFLEEPDGEALAVLMTTQYQQIIKTIVSRSQVLSFAPLSQQILVEKLIDKGINKPDALAVSQITFDLEEAIQFCHDNWIAQARSKVIQLVDEIHLRPKFVFITLQDQWMSFFKEKEDMLLGLDLLMIWYRDVLRIQVDQKEQIVNIDQENKLEEQALKLSQRKLGSNLQAVMDAKRRLGANAAPQLLMEQMLLRLQEG